MRWKSRSLLSDRHLLLVAAAIIAAALSPFGAVIEAHSAVPPPLSEAAVLQGVLRFGDGARDWREVELETESTQTLVKLRCRHFLPNDACFRLAEADAFEGARATVWAHREAGVLQLDVGAQRFIGYDGTIRRFSRFQVARGKPDWMYAVAACALLVVSLLLLGRQWRSWRGRSGVDQ